MIGHIPQWGIQSGQNSISTVPCYPGPIDEEPLGPTTVAKNFLNRHSGFNVSKLKPDGFDAGYIPFKPMLPVWTVVFVEKLANTNYMDHQVLRDPSIQIG